MDFSKDPDPTLTVATLSRLLHVTPRTIRRMVLRGDIPLPARVGGRRLLWRVADIDGFLVSGGTPPLHKKRPGRPRKSGGAS
ncbi:MAG: helix-turn-helix transcriptional regulator [Acidiferrobacter thiooxydans]